MDRFLYFTFIVGFILFWTNFLLKFLIIKIKSQRGLFGFTKTDLYAHWMLSKFAWKSHYDVYQEALNIFVSLGDSPQYFKILTKRFAYVCRPDDLQIVLNNSHCLEKSIVYNIFKSSGENGLITAPVRIWKRHRRFIKPSSYSAKGVEQYIDYFNREALNMIKDLEKLEKTAGVNYELGLWEPIFKATFNMILDVLGGDEMPYDAEVEKSLECFEKLSWLYSVRMFRVWLYPPYLFKLYRWLINYEKYFEFKDYLLLKKINEKKTIINEKQFISSTYEAGPISQQIVEQFILKNEKGEISYKDLSDHVVTMVAAGSETTATLCCFTMLMLACNRQIQEKVYEEIAPLLGTDDEPVDLEAICRMNYLEMCINETLRLYPPIPFTMRRATEDIKIRDDFIIKADTEIIIAHAAIHRNPNYYSNPNKWDPEHFTEENKKTRPKYAFIPFSAGPRGCIGSHYAMLVTKLVVAKIIKKYRAEINTRQEDIKVRSAIVLKHIGNFKVRLYERDHRQ